MSNNPLFPNNQDKSPGYILPRSDDKPKAGGAAQDNSDLAANVIRKKLANIYSDEPDANQELQESESASLPPSKHQRFMHELSTSGKSMAEIQTAWHNYYIHLPDDEKHKVWQEFYAANAQTSRYHKYVASQQTQNQTPTSPQAYGQSQVVIANQQPSHTIHKAVEPRTVSAIKQHLLDQVSQHGKVQAKHHLKSLGFGLAMGFLVMIIFLFGFFNQIIISPFIQPSRHITSTPLIVDASSISLGATPEVIIPKINVEIPVNYSVTSDNENDIENALEGGVVHYPSTVMPGQKGNSAFYGHSSNNIFNPGKYKFAFVLLHTLVKGDTFYLTYNGQLYVYQVIDRKIVPPSDVAVLNDSEGQVSTATLITCDPPGTSINRLIITGKQISPDPSGNTAPSTNTQALIQPAVLTDNGQSLWSRFWNRLF